MRKLLISFWKKISTHDTYFYWVTIFMLFLTTLYLYRNNSLLDVHVLRGGQQDTFLVGSLASVSAQLISLRNQDQYLINQDLEGVISAIEKTYTSSIDVYESLIKLRERTKKTATYDDNYVKILTFLTERNYASASTSLSLLDTSIASQHKKLDSQFSIPANIVSSNAPPGSGYQVQRVSIDIGEYMVSIVSADMNSTRVIVDTASDGTCGDNCPVMSVASYAGRSGAFAGINGSYFCPASYPSCAGKTNSFDTLAMNKNKIYFNSDNNVYSNVPAVIFSGSSARFVGRSGEWGRDTGVDGVLANQPLLVSGGSVVFGGDGDPKKGSKGGRSFVGATNNTVYIGVVHNVTVAEAARVLSAMGIQNALNLDSGGSTALWYGGYKAGPGRDIPNALLFVRK